MYIYESHMGGYFADDTMLDFDSLYCEECGDSDRYIGEANTYTECRNLIYGEVHSASDDIENEYWDSKDVRRKATQDMMFASETAQRWFDKPGKKKKIKTNPWELVTLPSYPMFTEEVETDSHGMNKSIKIALFEEQQMRQIGFTDYAEDRWYLCKNIDSEITFNLTIMKDGSDAWIDVLDEDFCQPYDYQSMLRNNPPTNKFAYYTFIKVEEFMKELTDIGIISGHVYGEYI